LLRKLADYERQLEEAGVRQKEVEEKAAKKEQQIGEAVREMLQEVDTDVVAKQLRGADGDQFQRLMGELNEAKGKNAAQVVQMLRKSSELRKRCDIWEVHLYEAGSVRIKGPDVEETVTPSGKDELTNQFMKLTKKSAEPKSLVIILFTHENATVGAFSNVEEGLDQVRIRWSASSGKSVQVTAPNFTATAP